MCIAILKPKNRKISDETLRICFENNPDGAGIAYADKGKLYVVKGFFDVDEFIADFRAVEESCNPNMLIHFRIRTSGKCDKNNTHPHTVNEKLCLIHNGVLDVKMKRNSRISDTKVFINRYLKDLRPSDLKKKFIKKLIEKAIGLNNKMVFLDNMGNFTICNEGQGHWQDGCWFSNFSYRFSKKTNYINSSFFPTDYPYQRNIFGRFYDEDYLDEYEQISGF